MDPFEHQKLWFQCQFDIPILNKRPEHHVEDTLEILLPISPQIQHTRTPLISSRNKVQFPWVDREQNKGVFEAVYTAISHLLVEVKCFSSLALRFDLELKVEK